LKSEYLIIHIIINNSVYGVNKNMKTNIILIALFVGAFMFPSMGIVHTADAEMDISHCANLEATAARPACEASAHVKPAPVTFDDNLMATQGTAGSAHATPIDPVTLGYSYDVSAKRMCAELNAKEPYGKSYRHELRENNRLRNGILGSRRNLMGEQGTASFVKGTPIDLATSSYSSDASGIQMGPESNANRQYGTSYRNDLRENKRLRNGVPGSGRKVK
jgi:hypothetical protein